MCSYALERRDTWKQGEAKRDVHGPKGWDSRKLRARRKYFQSQKESRPLIGPTDGSGEVGPGSEPARTTLPPRTAASASDTTSPPLSPIAHQIVVSIRPESDFDPSTPLTGAWTRDFSYFSRASLNLPLVFTILSASLPAFISLVIVWVLKYFNNFV